MDPNLENDSETKGIRHLQYIANKNHKLCLSKERSMKRSIATKP